MTKSGRRALRRYARTQGWAKSRTLEESTRIDRIVGRLMAEDPNLDEPDREWLEVSVRAPEVAQILAAFHYRGVPLGTTIH